jgi:hypothetical protein
MVLRMTQVFQGCSEQAILKKLQLLDPDVTGYYGREN